MFIYNVLNASIYIRETTTLGNQGWDTGIDIAKKLNRFKIDVKPVGLTLFDEEKEGGQLKIFLGSLLMGGAFSFTVMMYSKMKRSKMKRIVKVR